MNNISTLIVLAILLIFSVFVGPQLSYWMKCYSCGCPVSLLKLMKLKGSEKGEVVDAYIMLHKGMVPLPWEKVVELRKENPSNFIEEVSLIINQAKLERDAKS